MGRRNGLRKVVFFKLHQIEKSSTAAGSEEDLGKTSANSEWRECKWWENGEDTVSENVASYCSSSDQLKVFQFNILSDDMVNDTLTEKISTHKRFEYIAHKLLPSMNADVICLNEVGNGFLKKLLDECTDGWMKEGKYFYISHLDQERFFEIPSNKINTEQQVVAKKGSKKAVDDATQMTVEKASFVNLVISRIPFTQSHNYFYQNDIVYSRRPANVFTLANQVVVVNLHLKAYKECFPIRKKQLKCIYSLFRIPRVDFKMHEDNKEEGSKSSVILEDESRFTYHFGLEELNEKSLLFAEKKEFSENYSNNVKYVLMCGDYNLNHDFEEHMITDYDIVDVYAKLYPEKIGTEESLTFDYQNNPIVNLFSEDSRGRCRYDRMMMHSRNDSNSNFILSPTSCQVVENKAFEDNIFASDHFGLVSEFSIIPKQ